MKRREQSARPGPRLRQRRWILSILLAVMVVITMTPNIDYASNGNGHGQGSQGSESQTVSSATAVSATTADIPVTKAWQDAGHESERPDSVTVKLLADGTEVDSITLTSTDGWEGIFRDKKVFHDDGTPIAYTVEEVQDDSLKNYKPTNTSVTYQTIKKATINGFSKLPSCDKLTQSFSGSLLVEKKGNCHFLWTETSIDDSLHAPLCDAIRTQWNGSGMGDIQASNTTFKSGFPAEWNAAIQGGKQQNVKIDSNGAGRQITVGDKNEWSLIDVGTISLEDIAIPHWTITNTYNEPEEEPEQTPDITIPIEKTVEVEQAGTVAPEETFTFTATAGDNDETVGSTTISTDGANTYTGTITITGDDAEALRKAGNDITIKETAGGADGWTYSTKQYKLVFGDDNTTSLEEIIPDGIASKVVETASFTNTYTPPEEPEKTSINVTKVWNDNSDQYSKRPDEITVNLLADGKKLMSKVVTADANNEWKCTFDNLDVKDKTGMTITYTVTEDPVANYTPTVSGTAADGFTITNKCTYTPPAPEPQTTTFTVNKVWKLADGQTAPDAVQVQLMKNGSVYATQSVTALQGWTYTWVSLPLTENGAPINWSVQEVNPDNAYTVSIVSTGNSATITNTPNALSAGDTQVTVNKVWKLDNGGKATDSVQAQLYRNGEAYGDPVTLNAATNWTYTWNDLPKASQDGTAYTWTVQEVNVPDGFSSSVTGEDNTFTITNDDDNTPLNPLNPSDNTDNTDNNGTVDNSTVTPKTPAKVVSTKTVTTTTINPKGLAPKTGDMTTLGLWILLSCMAAALIAIISIGRKQSRSRRNR